MTVFAAGFAISRAIAYRYHDEMITLLAARAPNLPDALDQVVAHGWSHVVLDGKVFRSDRCAATTTSTQGHRINFWYSGKHHTFGGNVQAIMRPDGFPIWDLARASRARHDSTAARAAGVLSALYWVASQLDLPALADSGYKGVGHSIRTSVKQPCDGKTLATDHLAYNALHRATRARSERGFALLLTFFRVLQRITASPFKIGGIVAAGLVLTHSEYALRHQSC